MLLSTITVPQRNSDIWLHVCIKVYDSSSDIPDPSTIPHTFLLSFPFRQIRNFDGQNIRIASYKFIQLDSIISGSLDFDNISKRYQVEDRIEY